MINVKLCMMVVLIKLSPLMPLSLTLIVFQGHSNVKQLQLKKKKSSYPIMLELCAIVDYVIIFDFRTCMREIIDIVVR